MISYHVFFSAKSEADEAPLIAATRALSVELHTTGKIQSHRFLRVTNAASFVGLPRFQLIIDCTDQAGLDAAMAHVRSHIHEGPHGEILRRVSDFKVCFSADA
ncbi:MAG: hypothetical protein QM760_23275 [Nibricoccus sp.]